MHKHNQWIVNWFAAVPNIYTPLFWICTMVIPQYILTNLEVPCKFGNECCSTWDQMQVQDHIFIVLSWTLQDMLCHAYVWYWEENVFFHSNLCFNLTFLLNTTIRSFPMIQQCLQCLCWSDTSLVNISIVLSHLFTQYVAECQRGHPVASCLTLTFEVILSASYFVLLKVFLVL